MSSQDTKILSLHLVLHLVDLSSLILHLNTNLFLAFAIDGNGNKVQEIIDLIPKRQNFAIRRIYLTISFNAHARTRTFLFKI